MVQKDNIHRCTWCGENPLYIAYHDKEWGRPIHDDRLLFEFLVLEGAQAGLSWLTILKKRENYRKAFDFFNPRIVANYDQAKIDSLLANAGIVRNRRKITSAIKNAQAVILIQKEFGSLDAFLWNYVGGSPIQNHWKNLSEVPVTTELSDKMSKDFKKRGFSFVGSTICYSFMQAVGMVNDHTTDCFCHSQLFTV
ncbi:MAG: DNA-3-methyladenine glycosylase [Treponema sp. CETP13]|nr:MAG: DNA-3-methyladenine glycosylase [Treponema sp. CETP13]